MPTPSREQLTQWRDRLTAGDAEGVRQQVERLVAEQADASLLQLLGECYLALAQPVRAVVPLAAAVGLTDHAEPAALLARTLLELGRIDEALLAAQRVLRRDPRNKDALHVMQQVSRG